jgi:predicted HD superfamily hydrolase involved in NAD metabolism
MSRPVGLEAEQAGRRHLPDHSSGQIIPCRQGQDSAMTTPISSLQMLIRELPQGLQDHLHRTRDVALDLAQRHGVDTAKVELAALGHDICRAMDDEALLTEARAAGIAVHPVDKQVPVLLHGHLAAHRFQRDCGVTDTEVLEAVRWHSTSCANMGQVGLVVFLADKLDPDKADRNPLHEQLKKKAQENLEKAVANYLTAELSSLLAQGSLLHPASVEARNDLLMRTGM